MFKSGISDIYAKLCVERGNRSHANWHDVNFKLTADHSLCQYSQFFINGIILVVKLKPAKQQAYQTSGCYQLSQLNFTEILN